MSEVLDEGDHVLLGEYCPKRGDPIPKREDVEPHLAALLQAEHLNLLIGSGLTAGLAALAGSDDAPIMNTELQTSDRKCAKAIKRIERAASSSASKMGRGKPNIEDRLRIAIPMADTLKNLEDCRFEDLQRSIDKALQDLVGAVREAELALQRERALEVVGDMTLQGVLMTFLGSFASRVPTRDRLHVFTTNYDRVIEWGAELAGLRIVDRFVGTLQPVFRSSRLEIDYHYSPPGAVRDPRHLDGVFRLTKLHGSLDWEWDSKHGRVVRNTWPFGQVPYGQAPCEPDSHVLIYPNSSKDVETTFHPYADLFRDMAAALCRPQSALITYGYGFGDDHVNRIIRDMLTIPSTHLLIISRDDVSGRISKFAKDHGRTGQMSLVLGPKLAELPSLIEHVLPRPSAEYLLQKRAQLSRDRSSTETHEASSVGSSA